MKFVKNTEMIKLLRGSYNNSKHFMWQELHERVIILTDTRIFWFDKSQELIDYLFTFCPSMPLPDNIIQELLKRECTENIDFSPALIEDGFFILKDIDGNIYPFDKKLIPNFFKKKGISYSLIIWDKNSHGMTVYDKEGKLSGIILGYRK